MFYTGFNQPYQLVTFGNNYCDKESLGLILAVFYFMEILGCIFAGKLFDKSTSIKYVSKKCLIIFMCITMLGNFIAAYFELYYFGNNYGLKDFKAILLILVQFSCWGLSDSMVSNFITITFLYIIK
jgi:MFS family permease